MGFQTETGYSLPGGDMPLTHARILHAGNRVRPHTITASATAAASAADLANNGMTSERWEPFDNAFTSPLDVSATDWTASGVTVDADGRTLNEGTSTGAHNVSEALTLTAAEWILAFKVRRLTAPEIRVRANGAVDATCFFDLRDGTVGTAANCTGTIVDLGNDEFLCSIRFTGTAASWTCYLEISNGSEAVSYTGTSLTVQSLKAMANPSVATWQMSAHADQACDVFCIAGHNLWSGGGRIAFEHDDDDNATFTTIETISPTNDAPLMLLFGPVTSKEWRITIDRCAAPELAVCRVATALQMQRPIHDGHRPFKTNRNTTVRGTISESGDFLGRSKIRSGLSGEFVFPRLTTAWVDANLDGPRGLLQSVETEPFFIAWRPATYPEAHYCWTQGSVGGPSYDQRPNLQGFTLGAQALGYE